MSIPSDLSPKGWPGIIRDLLLPKLVSGEVDVEGVEIEVADV